MGLLCSIARATAAKAAGDASFISSSAARRWRRSWPAYCYVQGNRRKTMLTILLIVLLVLALGGGGWGYSRYGYASMSPFGLLLVVFVVLYFTGTLRFG
jgi:Protein of unknown function (DUF3309)